jgi:hypothetical protein
MNKNNFDLSGNTVTLDLTKLREVLESSTAALSNQLEDEFRQIRENIREAGVHAIKNNEHENFRSLSHANTARESFVRTAQQLADSIQAQFHVTEACKRDIVNHKI